ncbi:ISL3 family transposase [Streptomyces sp. NPDC056323]|uniref:ISL3 family transposase n=1 Tax=unclassified Streptomyces TaxID=2593676 RepID=UPI0035E333D6
MVLRLQVRRFICADTSCGRQTFVEQIPGLTGRHAHRTDRLRSALAEVGLALAGRAGARLADVFGISASRSTVLRLVDAMPDPQPSAPRVVGIDEYAMRKGRIYGTVLVDVETGRPVDLLPDREAATVAAWLAECPEVEVVCRDRAPFFAEGASTRAPTAVQVADRFHLWRNLGEATERCVSRHRTCLRAPFTVPGSEGVTAPPAPEAGASPWPIGHRFADRTREKHAIVHGMLGEGHSRRAVARELRLLTASTVPGRAPRVLGVDEFAFRKGCTYGTVLVDIEAGRVVDVLPDRTSETFAAWLTEHPGAEIVCRYRAAAYTKAVKEAAPRALEAADRWNLLQNLSAAVEKTCHQHRDCLRKRAQEESVTKVPEPPSMLLPPAELPRTQITERTRHRYEDPGTRRVRGDRAAAALAAGRSGPTAPASTGEAVRSVLRSTAAARFLRRLSSSIAPVTP